MPTWRYCCCFGKGCRAGKLVKKKRSKGSCGKAKKAVSKKDGTYIRFDDNAVVILDGKEPKGEFWANPKRN